MGQFSGTPFAEGERPGLQGIAGKHRSAVTCEDLRNKRYIRSSVNINATMRNCCPESPRWDYAIWYENQSPLIACVEVHPARSSHVDDIIAKKDWLEDLIKGNKLPPRRYYWIPTSGVGLSRSSPSWRKLALSKIRQCRVVFLDRQ